MGKLFQQKLELDNPNSSGANSKFDFYPIKYIISAMSPDGSVMERRAGWVPYPEGTVLPPTARDAFEDAVRFMGTILPRTQVRELVEGMDSDRVVEVIQGMPVRPHLNAVELCLGSTLEYCIQRGLVRGPADAIMTIESVRQEVLEGGVFVGQESTPNPQQ